jgi:hypothetical protein
MGSPRGNQSHATRRDITAQLIDHHRESSDAAIVLATGARIDQL